MAFIYILQSQKNGKYYLGSTEDILRRLKEHNSGKVYSTKRLLPLTLIFHQEFADMQKAQRIEIKLKKLKRRDYLEKIISDGFIKVR